MILTDLTDQLTAAGARPLGLPTPRLIPAA